MTDRSAASIEPPGTGRLLVVDLLNVAYFVSHGATFSPEAMTRRVLRVSQRFIDTVGASHLVYTTDLPGDTWREPIRDKTHSITRYARSRRRLQRRGELPAGVVVPEVAEVLARLSDGAASDGPPSKGKLFRVVGLLRSLGHPVVCLAGYEADDVIASIVEAARPLFGGIAIASNDRDLRALARDGAAVLFYGRRGYTTTRRPPWPELTQQQYGECLALTGAGRRYAIRGAIDAKTASRLLLQHGSIDVIYERLEEIEPAALRERLRAKEQDVRTLARYVPLRADLAVDIDWARAALPEAAPAEITNPYVDSAFGGLLLRSARIDGPGRASGFELSEPRQAVLSDAAGARS